MLATYISGFHYVLWAARMVSRDFMETMCTIKSSLLLEGKQLARSFVTNYVFIATAPGRSFRFFIGILYNSSETCG